MIVPTFTPASLLNACQHHDGAHVCNRVGTPMQAAWLPYEPTPAGCQARKAMYYLCSRHAKQWEQEGIPAWALTWDRDHRSDARVLLGEAAPVAYETPRQQAARESVVKGLFD